MIAARISTSLNSRIEMCSEARLSPDDLAWFKANETDENRKIGAILADFMKDVPPGLILDIGAGAGDVAAMAFSDRQALLVDQLDFSPSPYSGHTRIRSDFFDLRLPEGAACGAMVMSHVLQYIDDDLERLNGKISELAPERLITVIDMVDAMHGDILEWLAAQGIRANPESPIDGFPGADYRLVRKEDFIGTIDAPDFPRLAHCVGRILFDAPLTIKQAGDFALWLAQRLDRPRMDIPQTAAMYRRV